MHVVRPPSPSWLLCFFARPIRQVRSYYHTPVDCSGNDGVYVSRLRKDLIKENGFNFWVVSDNLLKGAALNSVQIAESLIKVGRV